MMKSACLVSALSMIAVCWSHILFGAPPAYSASGQWKITSVKICKNRSGGLEPTLRIIGSYPVYSFFIPRPVWTVNGTVVDAQPVYEHGRLAEFQLLGASSLLKTGEKNTIKFSLPDQNSSKVFNFIENRLRPGECFEFF